MGKRKFECILLIEAIVCIAFCLLKMSFSGVFSTIAAFPFEQIGWGLRNLSLSGAAGNALAVIIYILICLIPCLIWRCLRKSQKAYRIDAVLIGITLLLLIVIYYMVNPGLFQANVPGTAKWMLGCTFYSVLFGYLVIRILKMYINADAQKLQKGLKILLFFLNIVFVYIICGQSLETFIKSIQEVQRNNGIADIEAEIFSGISNLTVTYFFLTFHYLVNILPYLLDIVVVYLSIHMLDALSEDRYSEKAVKTVERLTNFCVRALMITITVDAVFNLLQLIFQKVLYQVNIVVVLPVFSIVFVFAALLFSCYIREDQKLKQDNDLFI